MTFALEVAYRYLFGKKSTNAINLITSISVVGIAIGTAALILILSVFNGFEGLMKQFLDNFNPDLKIEAVEGKYFDYSSIDIDGIMAINGVSRVSKVIEEVALLEYGSKQQIGIIKGVDQNYLEVTSLTDAISEGSFIPDRTEEGFFATIGKGIYYNLNVSLENRFTPLKIYVPNRNKKGPLDSDFSSRPLFVSGVFAIQNERDNQYVISSYDMISRLLELNGQVSAIELKIETPESEKEIYTQLENMLGESFKVLNRYQQDESFLKIMNIEKWSSYLIFAFTLLLIIFNVIGSLWMIVIDKKKDISILQSLGAPKRMIKNIFILEGGLISIIGFGLGFVVAVTFYILQKEIGLITVPAGLSIKAYPISMEFVDVFIIFLTVMVLGLLASLPASYRAAKVSPYVRVE